MKNLLATVIVTQSGEETPSTQVLEGDQHFLDAQVDTENRDIYLNFSSPEALYDFAKSLLQAAVFGRGVQKEYYPLGDSGGRFLVVNGVRLTENSSRIFLSCPDDPS